MKNEEQKVQEAAVAENEAIVNDVVEESEESNSRFRLERYDGIVFIPDVLITRSEYEIKKDKYWQYKIVLDILGRKQEINLVAGTVKSGSDVYKDKDIYEMLDFVFESFENLHFGIKTTNSANGGKMNNYFVVGENDGIFSPVPVCIARMSSLSFLSTYLSIIAKKYNVTVPSIF